VYAIKRTENYWRPWKYIVYKNAFCAYCHGLEEENFVCPIIIVPTTQAATTIRPSVVPFHRLIKHGNEHEEKDGQDTAITLAKEHVVVCLCTRPCDFSHTFWEGECVRDPTAGAFYYQPTNIRNNNSMRIMADLTLRSSLTIVLTDGNMEETLLRSFYGVFSSILDAKQVVNMTFEMSETINDMVELAGGRAVTYGNGTVISIKFDLPVDGQTQDKVASLLNAWGTQNNSNFDLSFDVYSHGVEIPVICDEGSKVKIPLTKPLDRLLMTRDAVDMSKVVKVVSQDTTNYIMCDTYATKFNDCKVVQYYLEWFRVDNETGNLTFISTGEPLQEAHAVVDETVFACKEKNTLQNKNSNKPTVRTNDNDIAVEILTLVGLPLSLVFLFLTIMTHIILKPLQTLPGKMLMHLCVNLFLAQLLFLTAVGMITDPLACSIMAAIQHFIWLATFFWMNAIAINLTRTFTGGLLPRSNGNTVYKYSVYAYGSPLVICIVCALLDIFTDIPIGYTAPKFAGLPSDRA
jgi:hypothetical protein